MRALMLKAPTNNMLLSTCGFRQHTLKYNEGASEAKTQLHATMEKALSVFTVDDVHRIVG